MCTQINLFMNHSSLSHSFTSHNSKPKSIQHNFSTQSRVYFVYGFLFSFSSYKKKNVQFILVFVVSHAPNSFFLFVWFARFEEFLFLRVIVIGFPHSLVVSKCLKAFFMAHQSIVMKCLLGDSILPKSSCRNCCD
jgi:hypothetical protein